MMDECLQEIIRIEIKSTVGKEEEFSLRLETRMSEGWKGRSL